jgi:hypothetical protein
MSRGDNSAISDRMALEAILRTDFYAFLQAMFPIISGGGKLLLNWHLQAIASALFDVIAGRTQRLIITVPFRNLKSICASIALPTFLFGRDPSRLICISYAESLARKHANDWLINYDPMTPQEAQSEIARENVIQWYTNTLLSRLDNKVKGRRGFCMSTSSLRLLICGLGGRIRGSKIGPMKRAGDIRSQVRRHAVVRMMVAV